MSFKKLPELYVSGLIEYITNPHPQSTLQQCSGEDCTTNPVYWDEGRAN